MEVYPKFLSLFSFSYSGKRFITLKLKTSTGEKINRSLKCLIALAIPFDETLSAFHLRGKTINNFPPDGRKYEQNKTERVCVT